MRSRRFQPQEPLDEPRFSVLSLVLLGLLLGLAGALYYAWVVDPIIYTDASPARLSDQYRREYIFLVSQSYAVDGDLEEARQRLLALDVPDPARLLEDELAAALRRGDPALRVRDLAQLAQDLGVQGAAVAVFAPTLAAETTPTPTPLSSPTLIPSPTATPQPSRTPRPTLAPTVEASPTRPPVFRLLSQERRCESDEAVTRIEVVVLDAFLDPLPGVEALLQWDGGSDHFFTGFKPEEGAGYGDFAMQEGVSYSVVLAEGSPTISGLQVENCPVDEGGLPGGWRLTFQNTIIPTATPESEP